VLTILPYLPIPNLEQAVMDLVRQAMPGDAANVFTDTVKNVVTNRNAGLLSFGFVLTLWTASSGTYAVMEELNVTHGVEETRPFWKARGVAVLLTLMMVVLVIGALALAVFGGKIQGVLGDRLGWSGALLASFAGLRWLIIGFALLLAIALTYQFAPDVRRKFALFTPGTVTATVLLALATIGFRLYVANFGKYDKVYGSLGAVIVLLMWLFVTGLVILVGAEVDVLAGPRAEGKQAEPPTPIGGRTQPA
jgi:membrane protein